MSLIGADGGEQERIRLRRDGAVKARFDAHSALTIHGKLNLHMNVVEIGII